LAGNPNKILNSLDPSIEAENNCSEPLEQDRNGAGLIPATILLTVAKSRINLVGKRAAFTTQAIHLFATDRHR
jgi:hypothetical protein